MKVVKLLCCHCIFLIASWAKVFDVRVRIHVVVNTLIWKFQVAVRHSTSKIAAKCMLHLLHDYFSSFNQSYHCFLASLRCCRRRIYLRYLFHDRGRMQVYPTRDPSTLNGERFLKALYCCTYPRKWLKSIAWIPAFGHWSLYENGS
mgnify:CR=1 FL=1